jgi:hypothetical protein
MCYELSREADSDEVLTALVHVTAIPVRDSIRILLSASCWMNRSFGPLAGRRYDFYRQGRQYRARERSHLRRSRSASLREIAAGLK